MTATKHGSKWLLALVLCTGVGCDGAPSASRAAATGAEETEVAEITEPSEPPPPPVRDVSPPPSIVAPEIVTSCAPHGPLEPELQTLVYSRTPSGAQRIDLAVPRGEGPHPWILVIHGGGWSGGQRAHVHPDLGWLVAQGYAAAALDYRLVARGARNRFPTQVADARCAVRYLRRHAEALGLDPDRAGAIGYSAGAHLAMMLATASEVDGLDECEDTQTSPSIRIAVSYFGPSDLRPEAEYDAGADRIVNRFLGQNRRREPELAALASPIAHIDADDAPVMLVHGTEDQVVPVVQSRAMRAALTRAGVPAQLVEVEGRGHGFRVFATELRAATCTTLAFLERAMGREPAAAP